MAHIRTVKPRFFRHELLQELEVTHAHLKPMLVFMGLPMLSDRSGRFEWAPRQIKLDVLPFIEFDMAATLELLERHGFVASYQVDGKRYGWLPTFGEHQRPHHTEKASKLPAPPLAHSEVTVDSPLVHREDTVKRAPSSVQSEVVPLSAAFPGSSPLAHGDVTVWKGRGREVERKGREGGSVSRVEELAAVPVPIATATTSTAPPLGPVITTSTVEFDPTPENVTPEHLARGLCEQIGTPVTRGNLENASAAIRARARAGGETFAEAHDYIRAAWLEFGRDTGKQFGFWCSDADYERRTRQRPKSRVEAACDEFRKRHATGGEA